MKKEQIFVVVGLVLLVMALLVPVAGAASVASGFPGETSVATLGAGLTPSDILDRYKCLDGGSTTPFSLSCDVRLR